MLMLYNTLKNQKERFIPIKQKEISMYVCGPTVYGDLHIGNLRPVIFFDMLKNFLVYSGYNVYYVSNITDIDDNIINKAIETHQTEKEVASKYITEYRRIVKLAGSQIPNQEPLATKYVKAMIKYIKKLIEKGFAYQTSTGVYFKVNEIRDYGTLSNQKIDNLEAGARVAVDSEKLDPKDFSLWKNTKIGITYKSPFGKGRPGWHTECAVINHVIFKHEIDIHGGGADLMFPHHENERAQTKAHDGHGLAKYWLHVGRVSLQDVKMSKSLGNTILAKDFLLRYSTNEFRYLMLSHHYRSPINYSEELMKQIADDFNKIYQTLKKNKILIDKTNSNLVESYLVDFMMLMNDDINTPNVISLIWEMLKELNKTHQTEIFNTIKQILKILTIPIVIDLDKKTVDKFNLWNEVREKRDFEKADQLRNELIKDGWI